MIVIADGGSSKVDWRALSDNGAVKGITTPGINPVFLTEDQIFESFTAKLSTLPVEEVREVWYYGAGVVSDETKAAICGALKRVFPIAECHADSDLMAAARALCGNEPGIACILGTGSNSCFYDGEKIVKNVRSGGFILGDEGGGARLGRLFVADFLKGLVPEPVASEFAAAFPVDYMTVVQNVYRGPSPSSYLGAFAPWIMERYDASPYVRELVDGNFRDFIERVLKQYDLTALPVGVVGGFGYAHRQVLQEVARPYGIRFQTILATPMDGLVAYHGENA